MVMIRVNSYIEDRDMDDYIDVTMQKSISDDKPEISMMDDQVSIIWKEGSKFIDLRIYEEDLELIIQRLQKIISER